MKTKPEKEHWAFQALRKRLSERTQIVESPRKSSDQNEPAVLRTIIPADWEFGTVFLFDPELKERLESFFHSSLYPPIAKIFESCDFVIPAADQIKLTEHAEPNAALNAAFLMTDPKRRVLTPESPWWYISYNLDVSDGGYFLRTELQLSLPFSVNSDWILEFLAATANDWSIPPSLSTDIDEFVLSFSRGQGRSFITSADDSITHLTEPFVKHIKIAKAIDRFSRQPEKHILRNKMLDLVKKIYGEDYVFPIL
ncbi:MAG TPA: hypothetical protein VK308_14770 [Pyrinomonadaceae bacterium]|nr:hypothetical protein [Pyrinomonadaceae bacterium]